MPSHRLTIAREQYKFSCAHMTVFPDGTKERLHGHNYQLGVAIDVSDVALAAMIPFAPVKAALAALCAAWKERVMIAEASPHLQVLRRDAEEVELRLCGQRYVFPGGDVLFLPIDNISVEALAAHAAAVLRRELDGLLSGPHVLAFEVSCEESPGQGARCRLGGAALRRGHGGRRALASPTPRRAQTVLARRERGGGARRKQGRPGRKRGRPGEPGRQVKRG